METAISGRFIPIVYLTDRGMRVGSRRRQTPSTNFPKTSSLFEL